MAELPLSPAVFSILSNLIEEKVGLHYGLLDREILEQKAASRAVDAGFDSLLDYYYFLRYDDAANREIRELTENLVVNETYFFREWPAIETAVESFIAPACATGRKVRVWSAACATGEEPLSLAMLLDSRNLLDQVEIVATDISAKALARARQGRYGKRAVRRVPSPQLLERYIRAEGEGYSVPSELIERIAWKSANLLNDLEVGELGTFDLILCRNVLIYFADPTVKGVLERLSNALRDDGALFVGISESLLRYGSAFAGEECKGTFVYRKSVKL